MATWPLKLVNRMKYLAARNAGEVVIGMIWEFDSIELRRLTALDKSHGVSRAFLSREEHTDRDPFMIALPPTPTNLWSPDTLAKFDDPQFVIENLRKDGEGKWDVSDLYLRLATATDDRLASVFSFNGFKGRIRRGQIEEMP